MESTKVNALKIRSVEMEKWNGQVVLLIMVIGWMTNVMDKVSMFILMVMFMMGSLSKISVTAKENGLVITVNSMMDHGLMINSTEKVLSSTWMEMCILVNSKMTKITAKAFWNQQMVILTKENGNTITNMEWESKFSIMAKNMKVCTWMD